MSAANLQRTLGAQVGRAQFEATLDLLAAFEALGDTNAASQTFNYRTPLGAFEFWSDAAEACERADLDPCECIEYVGTLTPPTSTCIEHAYGSTVRLSFQIKVF